MSSTSNATSDISPTSAQQAFEQASGLHGENQLDGQKRCMPRHCRWIPTTLVRCAIWGCCGCNRTGRTTASCCSASAIACDPGSAEAHHHLGDRFASPRQSRRGAGVPGRGAGADPGLRRSAASARGWRCTRWAAWRRRSRAMRRHWPQAPDDAEAQLALADALEAAGPRRGGVRALPQRRRPRSRPGRAIVARRLARYAQRHAGRGAGGDAAAQPLHRHVPDQPGRRPDGGVSGPDLGAVP